MQIAFEIKWGKKEISAELFNDSFKGDLCFNFNSKIYVKNQRQKLNVLATSNETFSFQAFQIDY